MVVSVRLWRYDPPASDVKNPTGLVISPVGFFHVDVWALPSMP